MDAHLGAVESGDTIDGFKVGEVLGAGAFGRVHRLHDAVSSTPIDEVIKVLPKREMTTNVGIKELDRQIQIMKMLSRQPYGHPNLPKLLNVYHTGCDVLLRMSYGGSMDLYKWLKLREGKCKLVPSKVMTIMSQCLEVLYHLHTVAKVVHADIKPENLIVSENPNAIKVMLVDFDLACVTPVDGVCSGSCGSFPFMAPETMLNRSFVPYPTDIWSMGVVFLEVLCCVDILRQALHLKSGLTDKQAADKSMMQSIARYFERSGSVDDLLGMRLRSELASLSDAASLLLNGMLAVTVRDRWNAAWLHEEMCTCPTFRGFL